jgi:DNA-directed RNA polymerase
MDLTHLEDLCWDLVVACIIKPKATFTEVVGKLYKRLKLETPRMGMETISEMIGILNDHPFIVVEYPKHSVEGVLMIHSKVKLTATTQRYLDGQRYILPSIVRPSEVTNNQECGYQTIKESLILGGKAHDKFVNLAHINRVNNVPLAIDDRIIRSVNPVFKLKEGEDIGERIDRCIQWTKLNEESIAVYVKLIGQVIYLTHKYDERCRTYASGHHAHTQGDDYRKAMIELAEPELVNC